MGTLEYDTITDAFARESREHTMTPFQDPDFGRHRSENIRKLFAGRTKELPSRDFVEMLRSAIKEDKWMIYLHGGVLGLAGTDSPRDLRMTEEHQNGLSSSMPGIARVALWPGCTPPSGRLVTTSARVAASWVSWSHPRPRPS